MLEDLKEACKRIVGAKQTIKAIREGQVEKVFVARDADDYIVNPVIQLCESSQVEILFVESMKELGAMCGIDVAASTVALIKN